MKIHIPKPCHENWNEMTANEKGRFCDACSQTVIDFTSSTEEEINVAMKSDSKICGRFREKQLQQNVAFWSKLALGILFTGGIANNANAQQTDSANISKQIDSATIKEKKSFTVTIGNPKFVYDERTAPTYVLNGKKISYENFLKVDVNDIKSVNVIKEIDDGVPFGHDKSRGSILIETKRKNYYIRMFKTTK